ncbi:MAG: XTP/dITP diphosphatase [Magnetococcales bacterium]|nr:XTP/dITP diphosphatase [Magnetococcales bacterium]
MHLYSGNPLTNLQASRQHERQFVFGNQFWHPTGQAAPLKLVIATRNRKKMEEIRRILTLPENDPFSLDDFPGCPEVIEDGMTFTENADKKALAVARFTGLPALADDSGLVVDGLDGAPGVYSARYAGDEATDAQNVAKLLDALAARPQASRSARFECVLALADPNGQTAHFTGTVEGRIADHPMGHNGFGYDPIFIPVGHDLTFALMPAADKDAMSHRGRALAMLAKDIHNFFGPKNNFAQ